jgi:hypothetical protein
VVVLTAAAGPRHLEAGIGALARLVALATLTPAGTGRGRRPWRSSSSASVTGGRVPRSSSG